MVLIVLSCNDVETKNDYEDIIDKRKSTILRVLNSETPVITLKSNEFLSQKEQNEIFNSESLEKLFQSENKQPVLNEVLSISKVRPSDITNRIEKCKSVECLRIELYNYAYNGTSVLTIDREQRRIMDTYYYPEMQGNISEELSELAIAIALSDENVKNAYGEGLNGSEDVRMEATKTALNRTKCQRSKHLCVAPTFVKGDKALWAIVDLTDLKVAGIKWTDVGTTGMEVTERSAQNDMIMGAYCDIENTYENEFWKINYGLTRSDGLKLYNISYKKEPIVKSIKTVDWHVSYSQTEGFGYSDAMGCPEFSQAAVVAIDKPVIMPVIESSDTVGFSIQQDYFSEGWPTPCSYNYRQVFNFYNDGSFRPVVGSLGRGCGTDGIYRPVTRISFFGDTQEYWSLESNKLKKWQKEKWVKENESYDYLENNYLGKLVLAEGKQFMVEANKGQFLDGSRGDNAYIYLTKIHDDREEGESDLPTIGPCCNTDYKQGPEKFIEGESLKGASFAFWYVPEIRNDGQKGEEYCWAESVIENGKYVSKVYPCYSGPKFVRVKS